MALLTAALFMAALLSPFGTGEAQAQTNPPPQIIEAVDDGGSRWEPANVTVNVGDTVRWEFDQATMPHTVTNNSANWQIDETRDAGGTAIEYTFTEAGQFDFLCKFHAGMTGTVTVVDDGGGDPPPGTLDRVMVFSKTAGFRHSSIPDGIAAIQQLGAQNGFEVDATEDATRFNDANLAQYDAVVFLSTTGDVLDNEQQGAFERYIASGRGYVGIHAAADTEYDWSWYGDMLGGAYFQSHPANQTATVNVEDAANPSTAHLPADWSRFDEWYNYRANPRGKVHVLATLDETTYDPGSGAMGSDHPISWCTNYGGGRSFYTGMGHTEESYSEENFTRHVLGGLQWASGAVDANCGDPREAAPSDGDFEQVTLAKGGDILGEPNSIAVLPNGNVLSTARDGSVNLTTLGGVTTSAANVPVYTHDEDGLQGIAIDPNFAENGWVYLYYAPPLDTPAGDAPATATDPSAFESFEGHNQLSRFKFEGGQIDLSTEQQILQVPADRGICCHAGGEIDFDAQGNLFLSTGDDTNPFESDGYTPIDERSTRNPAFDGQRSSANTNDLRGKLLRISVQEDGSYTVPSGNLFAPGMADTKPEIYAMGFRNPFRFAVDQATGDVMLGDYGPDAGAADPNRGPGGQVEFNLIKEAGNYGWPYCTGNNTAAETYNDYDFATGQSGAKFDCQAPVNESPRNTGLTQLPAAEGAWIPYDNCSVPEFGCGSESPMGGPTYNFDPNLQSDVKLPEFYDGKKFLYEWGRGWIKTVTENADGSRGGIQSFFDTMDLVRPMNIEFGPDGSLYVYDYGSSFFGGAPDSALYKINYVKGARSPIAVAKGTPESGLAPLEVQFSSEGSRDPDGDAITYSWDFDGDGASDSTEQNPTHTYTQNGTYNALLTVTDPTGKTGTSQVVITVGNTKPTVEINAPPDGGFFDYGDEVAYEVAATDPEDGEQIDCSRVKVDTSLGHNDHSHGDQNLTGCEGSFKIPAPWEGPSEDSFYVVKASYTDGGAQDAGPLTGTDQVILQPNRMQAEHYDSTGRAPNTGTGGDPGVQKETTGDTQGGVQNIGFIEDGDYVSFTPMNLLNINSLDFRVASAGAGGTIQVRLDSPDGPLVAETEFITPTGDWQTYKDVELPITDPGGTHELFFVFRGGEGGLMNVNWIDFNGRGVAVNARPRVDITATPTEGEAPLTVEFDGNATDADGDEIAYAWDFENDGTVDATTEDASHTYTETGSYTAKLTATDAKGASRSATVDIRARQACGAGGGPSDEFDGTSLDQCRWTKIVREDPAGYSVADGALNIDTGNGTDMYGANTTAENVILQPMPGGAWEATTRLSLDLLKEYEQAGLMVYGNDQNFIKLSYIKVPGGRNIEFIKQSNGAPMDAGAEDRTPLLGDEVTNTVFLKVYSDGTDLRAAWSPDGTTWTNFGRARSLSDIPDPHVGMAAFNGNGSGNEARFDFFRVGSEIPFSATANADKTSGRAPLAVNFTGSSSGGEGVTYAWDFGVPGTDADTSTEQNPAYTYEQAGTYTATLTATDALGATSTDTVDVTVNPPRQPCDTPYTPEAGYEMLFDGTNASLQDWTQSGPGSFEHDGCAIKSVGGLGLFWHTNGGQEFQAPYSLKLEWMKPGDDNSGVFVGFPDPGNDPFNAVREGEEIQIDDSDNPAQTTGAIYLEQAADEAARASVYDGNNSNGQWQEYEIRVETDRIIVYLNGVKINEWVNDDPNVDLATGYVGVQNHGSSGPDNPDDVFFRNIRIMEGEANNPPVAANDTASTNEDEPADMNVLGNDNDPDGDQLSVTGVSDPDNGSASVNTDGTVKYTPDADYAGADSFTYTISDGEGGTDTATVDVTVNPINDAPVARDDEARTRINRSVTVEVLANDRDVEDDALSVAGETEPAHGQIRVRDDGLIFYTPDRGFKGTDTFTYKASDGQAESKPATVTVRVVKPGRRR